ncbi:MAG: hypothetical protein C4297_06300 [Gemmataceae bacterium]
MRFWIAVSVCIIILSAALTYVSLYIEPGASQTLEPKNPAPNSTGATKRFAPAGNAIMTVTPVPRIRFFDYALAGNAIIKDAGDSEVERDHSVEFHFINDGDHPLEIGLTETSCGCMHEVTLDGTPLLPRQKALMKAPKEEGILRLTWKPRQEQLGNHPFRELRFVATFSVNDERFPNGLRIEILTRLVPPRKRS